MEPYGTSWEGDDFDPAFSSYVCVHHGKNEEKRYGSQFVENHLLLSKRTAFHAARMSPHYRVLGPGEATPSWWEACSLDASFQLKLNESWVISKWLKAAKVGEGLPETWVMSISNQLMQVAPRNVVFTHVADTSRQFPDIMISLHSITNLHFVPVCTQTKIGQ